MPLLRGFRTLLVSLFTLSALVLPASAQEQLANPALRLTTSALPLTITIPPGTSQNVELRIRNDGAQLETLKVALVKFSVAENTDKPVLSDFAKSDESASWVTFSQDTVFAEPGVWKTITATISVPKSAAFSYYYGVTFGREQDPGTPEESTRLTGAAAILMLLDVPAPGTIRQLEATKFSSSHKVYEFLPADFALTLHNTGNVHAAPRGNIFITKNGTSDEPIVLEINQNQGNILPGSIRTFDTSWEDGYPIWEPLVKNGATVLDSKGRQKNHLSWKFKDGSSFRFGKYTAQAVMVYNDGARDVPIESTLVFWVIPWRAILALLLVLGISGVGISTVARKTYRRVRRTT